jgi:hypothetical protein
MVEFKFKMSANKGSYPGEDEDLVYSSVENTNRNYNSNTHAYSDNNMFRRSSQEDTNRLLGFLTEASQSEYSRGAKDTYGNTVQKMSSQGRESALSAIENSIGNSAFLKSNGEVPPGQKLQETLNDSIICSP